MFVSDVMISSPPALPPQPVAGQAELAPAVAAPPPDTPAAFSIAVPAPQGDAAQRAVREWQAHVDAGRIGVAAPVAEPAPGFELRFASLAAALGHTGRGSVW